MQILVSGFCGNALWFTAQRLDASVLLRFSLSQAVLDSPNTVGIDLDVEFISSNPNDFVDLVQLSVVGSNGAFGSDYSNFSLTSFANGWGDVNPFAQNGIGLAIANIGVQLRPGDTITLARITIDTTNLGSGDYVVSLNSNDASLPTAAYGSFSGYNDILDFGGTLEFVDSRFSLSNSTVVPEPSSIAIYSLMAGMACLNIRSLKRRRPLESE